MGASSLSHFLAKDLVNIGWLLSNGIFKSLKSVGSFEYQKRRDAWSNINSQGRTFVVIKNDTIITTEQNIKGGAHKMMLWKWSEARRPVILL